MTNGYIVDGKETKLLQSDWDFLILLDACRYDMFEKVYREFFNQDQGILKKAISPATWTLEWAEKVLKNVYNDIIYISPNPFINSYKKIEYRCHFGDFRTFEAKKHFYKIVDLWKFGWNKKLGNVHPMMVNKSFVENYIKFPKKRFIIHYMQPHNPYITIGGRSAFSDKTKGPPSLENEKQLTILKWMIRKRFFGDEFVWKIRKIMNKNPDSCEAIAFNIGGRKAVKNVYKDEIRLALKYIQMLTDSIKGKWLITSDHGERLGERHGWYGHAGPRDKWVTEVPFFKLDTR